MEKVNWVLLRGLAREKGHWASFDKKMQSAFNGDVLCLDLPGAGDNLNEQVPLSIDEMTDFIRENWLQQRGDKKWSLLAISLGGMIALNWSSRYPEDFQQLVTINTSSKKFSGVFERISPLAIRTLLSTLFINDAHKRESLILSLITNHENVDKQIAKDWAQLAKTRHIKIISFLRQLFAASKFRLPDQIVIPYLALAAQKDRFTNSECSRKIASHFGAKLELHPSAGHDLPIDDGDWIIEKIKEHRLAL
ncbi:hypothetical protein BIY24_10785 [Halobacteriovorax marinus]|uniref:alpha/beta fold hydrolase n=1 Tax=Halobacteriovorax marinus TaxID=97084 RepID=UPI000BC314C1|nr:alpha/beta hydrolase [Halobacteriovorax marinus]ATH08416.1 hypothetical protein BIY24_10785 [Halobacteriovorax marinus]